MITASRFFMFFLVCNATDILHAMNDHTNHWNDDSTTVEDYKRTKNLTKHKLERTKKNQNNYRKKNHGNVLKRDDAKLKKTTT